jgi:hypothetical protein
MQRELQRPEIETKPDWHGRNEVEAIKSQDEEAAISLAFAELGAGCSKDGLGQDVPATSEEAAFSSSVFCPPTSVLRLPSSDLCLLCLL